MLLSTRLSTSAPELGPFPRLHLEPLEHGPRTPTVLAASEDWSSVLYLTDTGGATAIFHREEVQTETRETETETEGCRASGCRAACLELGGREIDLH